MSKEIFPNVDTFQMKNSVLEIAKLLSKYYEYDMTFDPEQYKTWFHP